MSTASMSVNEEIRTAVAAYQCWTCHKALRPGEPYVFLVDPRQLKQRISDVPPSHPECVRAAAGKTLALVYVRSFEVLQSDSEIRFRFSKPIRMR